MKKLYEFIRITDGTWALPFTKEKAEKLYDIMCTDKYKTDEEKKDVLYGVFGDDNLFDDLAGGFSESIIINHLIKQIADWDRDPSLFRIKLEPEAREILEKIIKR